MRRVFASLPLVLLLLTSPAWAGVHTSKTGKVSIEIPEKWPVVGATDELLRTASPDGDVAFVFWVVDKPDTKAALTKLERELYSSIQGLKWVSRTKRLKINRIPATWVEGTGVNARGAQLDVLVVVAGPTPAKKGVIMLAVVEHEKLVANKKTIQSLFQTLKRAK